MIEKIALVALMISGCAMDVGETEHLNQPLPDGCHEAPELDCGEDYSIFCSYHISPGPELICERVWIRTDDIGYCCG
jgi:hypothetical protein